jgi:hypothetical protein
MRVAMQGTLGKLALDIHGALGSLDPLDALIHAQDRTPGIGRHAPKLEVPVIARGRRRSTRD